LTHYYPFQGKKGEKKPLKHLEKSTENKKIISPTIFLTNLKDNCQKVPILAARFGILLDIKPYLYLI
jgi:hypothetical protein